ncbi:MAG: hypothetical protein KatS3mg077_1150 [Candidatus Binatia bacterium]|nr:MAG: hypothetical protein KatS3mg077_1150 [Candidatus Binatia bacterium]
MPKVSSRHSILRLASMRLEHDRNVAVNGERLAEPEERSRRQHPLPGG